MEPAPASTAGARIRRSSIGLVAVTVLNLAASYLREMLVAATYGASAVTDAYFSGLTFVMTLSDLLISAALLTSFVPVLAPIVAEAGETLARRRRLIGTAALATLGAGLAIGIAAWLLMGPVMRVLLPGADPATQALATAYGRHLVWLLPILSLMLLFSLALNAHGEFALPALSWPVMNLTFVAVVAAFGHPGDGEVLTLAAVLGPLAGTLLLAGRLVRRGLIGFERPDFTTADVRLIWRLSRPMVATLGLGSSVGLLMVSHLLLRRYASGFGEGAVSALGYAFRIYEVPVTLAANTAGILLLPAAAKLHAAEERERIAAICRNALLWGTILLAPAAVIAWVEADWIIEILLRRGRFSIFAAALMADALRGFAAAILFEAALVVLYRIFYGMRRPLLPVTASVVSLLSLVLLLQMAGASGTFVLVPASLSASFAVGLVVLLAVLFREMGRRALPDLPTLAVPLLTAVAGGWIWTLWEPPATTLPALFGMAVFGAAYAGTTLTFLPRQRAELLRALHRGR